MQIRLASVSDTNPSGVQEDVSLEFSKSSALICTGCLIYKQYNLLTLVTHKLEVDQLFFFLSPVALSLVAKRELCPRSWSLQHIFKGEESTDQVLPFKHASLSYLFSSRSPLPAPHLLVWTDYIVLFFFKFFNPLIFSPSLALSDFPAPPPLPLSPSLRLSRLSHWAGCAALHPGFRSEWNNHHHLSSTLPSPPALCCLNNCDCPAK